MVDFSLLQPYKGVSNDRQSQSSSINVRSKMVQAYQAVIQENRAAAVDCSELSQNSCNTGSFQFNYSSEMSFSSSMEVSWQGEFNNLIQEGAYSTNFSFSFSISASFEVSFANEIAADDEAITGSDFSFDRKGLLSLMDELKERLGLDQEEDSQLDLSSNLDDKLISVLQKLGLLDSEGKATPALQLLSDYADLGRFTAGQQVASNSGLQYSQAYSAQSLSWQSWSQRVSSTEAQDGIINFVSGEE